MTDELSGIYAHSVDAIAKELRQEFIDEAGELLAELALLLDGVRHERNSVEELTAAFSRTALKLRVQAGCWNYGSYGFNPSLRFGLCFACIELFDDRLI